MIKSIAIKKVATYNEVGIQINNLKKINFFYGANGSGKTTITKFLYNPEDVLFPDCSLDWQNNSPIKTLVYNKDFRDRNFVNGGIDGVFTLWQATNEEIEAIAVKQAELLVLKKEWIEKRGTQQTQVKTKEETDNKFREEVWLEIYKKYENDFKDAFRWTLQKESFKDRLILEYNNNITTLLDYTELKKRADIIFGKTPVIIALFNDLNFERLIELEEKTIWGKKIIGKTDIDIARLIQKLNLNDWVNEGMTYLQDNTTCPFCQQETITDDFRKQLENYFDESFVNDTKIVKTDSEEYNRIAENLINELTQIESREKAKENTKLNIEQFSAYLKTLSSQFIANKELLNNKIREPSRSIAPLSVKEQIEAIQRIISEANTEIKKHNAIVVDFDKQKNELISAIWKLLVEENRGRIQEFLKLSNGLQKGIDVIWKTLEDLIVKFKMLDEEIKKLNKGVTSIQPSIDEINKILKSYGFHNFEIVPSKTEQNRYQIQREDWALAESTLSEGEITFITFLYFLQLAKGGISEDAVTEERVLIIDDPISSLDSNILFVVSSLVKEIIKSIKKNEWNIRQLLLFSHNVYFHKEVSFVDWRTPENNDTFFWILRRSNNHSSIECFEKKNPIQNSYELLWQELKNRGGNSGVTIQNTMRRIIENYFKILGKYKDDDLILKFTNNEEKEICRSLICWINDGSHCIPDDLFIERQESVIDKYFEVFRNIFDNMGHPEHYKMMMGIEE